MLQRLLIIIIILSFWSCTTGGIHKDESVIQEQFDSELIDDWRDAIKSLREDPNANYIKNIFKLYLSRRYDPIKEELGSLLLEYIDEFNLEVETLLSNVTNADEVESLMQMAKGLERSNKIKLVEGIYLSEPSELRSLEIEYVGRNLIDYNDLDPLFHRRNKKIKLGVISSAAYMRGDDVRFWLKDKMFDPDEEIASGALFSLSKHGSAGFLLLADNLLLLSPRLQLIAVDILTFNKVVRAYPFYADLLVNPDPLLTQRILSAYRDFGKKNDLYVIDALRKAHPDLTWEIIKIIDDKTKEDYLSSIEFLLYREDLRYNIINLAFNRESWIFLTKQLLTGNNNIVELIITTAVERGSDFLFFNKKVNSIAIEFFLENYDLSIVLDYFESVGIDNKYSNDYLILQLIYKSLNEISYFEEQNGKDEIVTAYFELEQRQIIAKNKSDSFFKDMENWLKTRDNNILKEENPAFSIGSGDIKEDRNIFLESLDNQSKEKVLNYESNKLGVLSNYRQVTYRLKDFAELLIVKKGFEHLIK